VLAVEKATSKAVLKDGKMETLMDAMKDTS